MRAYLGLGALAAIGVVVACGSKSGLLSGSGQGGSAAAGGSPADASAGSGGVGTGGAGGSAGAAGAGGVVVQCTALEAGVATEVLSFPDRHAVAPSAVLLDEVSPPRIALQAFATGGSSVLHDDIRVARFFVDDAEVAGVSLEIEPILVGIESHGWGNLAVATGGLGQLGVTWHGDPGGFGRPMFRAIEIDSWTPGAAVDLASVGGGEAVVAFAAGPATGAFGVGYSGNGYGVVWRQPSGPGSNSTRPLVAVIDSAGTLMLGPHEVSAPTEYPGRSPSVVWTGATYLLATAVRACKPADWDCVPNSIVITRLRPASGDAIDDSGVELVSAIPAESGFVPGRPMLARDGDRVRIAWIELPETPGAAAHVRLTMLTPNGSVAGEAFELLPSNDPKSRVALHAEAGVTALVWAEEGDANLADSALGRSRIVVRRRELDGTWLGAEIASPLFHDYGAPGLIRRGKAESLLAVWGARSMKDGHDVSYAARLDCIAQTRSDGN